jgi:uncharacterized membrane protein (UPF0182 family)
MPYELPSGRRRSRQRPRLILLGAVVVVLFLISRWLCDWVIDYLWWNEMGQVSTWVRLLEIRYLPFVGAWLIVGLVMWVAHAGGLKYAGMGLRDYPLYSWIATAALVFVALILAGGAADGWVIARYFASLGGPLGLAQGDPAFGLPLTFYFFDLPFYRDLIGFLELCMAAGAVVYYVTARGWQIKEHFPGLLASGHADWDDIKRLGRLETGLLQVLLALFLVALAAHFWLGRYDLLYSDHGNLLVGMDYVEQHVGLPLQTAKAVAALLAALLVMVRKRRWALGCAVVLLADWIVPPVLSGFYVRPNELVLERPYLERHIEATRNAYGLNGKARDVEYAAHKEGRIDFTRNQPMLDNVRLWDWRAFHDTLSQSQPLRPYAYADTDVDRYQIDGQLRQVLLAPRELDLNQLGEAQRRWINTSLTFTHGYGLALAEASKISPSGLPELLIRNAPVEVLTPSLKLTRPELYYGEQSHEPVFVGTSQGEFDYPSNASSAATPAGSSTPTSGTDVEIHYDGKGGFPMSSYAMRLVAAWREGDWNIALSNNLTPGSRMMIHRKVPERLAELAEFITWDTDPYIVITEAGRLEWIVDGYTLTAAHPYSRPMSRQNGDEFNYIRNSVKAVVDAYDGTVKLYVFDDEDPLIQTYQKLFPGLFTPASEMPADTRAHVRAPETLFRVQAEIYRTYHMREPESFFNRADQWDLATFTTGQAGAPAEVTPTYMVLTLPGETKPEFVLTVPFTPRNKQNLIGMMVARCDGAHLGEILFLQMPKQEIIPGPLQIEALINQDQVISKDLSLWNQQGSQVLRSQVLMLPIDQTLLFVAPIYIQASQARMPQLEKVVLAVGSTLVYADTYQQALAELAALQKGQPLPAAGPRGGATVETSAAPITSPAGGAPAGGRTDARIDAIRQHLDRYRTLSAQGHWSEAGKELEAVEALAKK